MLDFFSLKTKSFGLDISESSLKIVNLEEGGGFLSGKESLSLGSYNCIPIEEGIIKGSRIKNEEALVNLIEKGVEEVKGKDLGTNKVIASLPEEKAFLEVIQMPKMEEEEAKKAVRYEAENYIPFPMNEVYFDSQIIPPVKNNLDHLDVLITAYPREIVDSYISCLKKAGLEPQALEIESQAIARAIVKDQVSKVPLLMIDLGAAGTSFIIYSGYSSRFTASVPVSADGFTRAVSRELEVNLKKAEKLKRKYGLSREGEKGEKVFEALVSPLTDLVEQTQTYLEYYHTHEFHEHLPENYKEVSEILLCGGGANLKGLTKFLSSSLKMSVNLGNPWINILPEDLKEIPELSFKESLQYTTSLGLALRGSKSYRAPQLPKYD